MRRIIGAAFVSLDGVMQAPGGPSEDWTDGFRHGGWLGAVGDEAVFGTIGELFGKPFDLLLGRRTYDIFASYWPYVEGEMADMGRLFDGVTKYVMTRGDQPLEWQNSERIGSLDALRAIRSGEGPDILIQGSTTLYPALLAAGMLDRLVLMIAPIVLGSGKRLFGDGTPPETLRMTQHKVGPNGNIVATYEPAGDVVTSDIGPRIESERDTQRQRRMKEGSW